MEGPILGERAARLLAKYEEIRALRREAHAAPPVARLRALAHTYPGALRELDQLSLEAIDARIEALRASPPPPWTDAMDRFHAELAVVLRIKRWLRGRAIDDGVRVAFAIEHAGDPDALAWTERLAAIAAPPGGRVSRLVPGLPPTS